MVVITVTDSRTSPTSVHFAKMLVASLNHRSIESFLLVPKTSDAVVNHNTSDTLNSDFMKELHKAGSKSDFHIDVRTFDPTSAGKLESLDFVVTEIPGVSDKGVNMSVLGYLDNFSEVEVITMNPEVTFCSNYCGLVLSLPTVTLLISEASSGLYRAAADELAEVVEQVAPRRMPVD